MFTAPRENVSVDYFEQRQEAEEKYIEMLFTDFDEEMLFVFFR